MSNSFLIARFGGGKNRTDWGGPHEDDVVFHLTQAALPLLLITRVYRSSRPQLRAEHKMETVGNSYEN